MTQKKVQLSRPRTFVPNPNGDPSASNATAIVFIAETLAGIEWELVQLNDRLSEIYASLWRQQTPQRRRT